MVNFVSAERCLLCRTELPVCRVGKSCRKDLLDKSPSGDQNCPSRSGSALGFTSAQTVGSLHSLGTSVRSPHTLGRHVKTRGRFCAKPVRRRAVLTFRGRRVLTDSPPPCYVPSGGMTMRRATHRPVEGRCPSLPSPRPTSEPERPALQFTI